MKPMEAWSIISANLAHLVRIRRCQGDPRGYVDAEIEAEVIAFKALQEMQERQHPKPLPIDKLKEWQEKYWDNDGERYRDLDRGDDGTPGDEVGRFEIVFDFQRKRYYCFVDAINVNEALGIFFRNHDGVVYSNVVDHIEI